MPRGAKTIDNCAGHRTKKEKESRKNAELGQLTGKKLTELTCATSLRISPSTSIWLVVNWNP